MFPQAPHHIVLSGIVGSLAYGLEVVGSDVDRLGIYAAPTVELHGLTYIPESIVTTSPDHTLHEARKFCRLALKCNPTVTELLWLPDDLYDIVTPHGEQLIDIRSDFLSARLVKNAYLGYATQQFGRLKNRGDGSFSADTRKRTAKHARHLMRLCHQGHELYTTGRLTIRVQDPEKYHQFGAATAEDPNVAIPMLDHYAQALDNATSALPDHPNTAAVDRWLRRLRAHLYTPS